MKTASHAVFDLKYHLVLVVKYRKKAISSVIMSDLQQCFTEVLLKWRCRLLEFGGEGDHVHLLIEAHPSLNLARMVGNLKTVSSRLVRKNHAEYLQQFFWKPFFWSKAYAVTSVGSHANLETLIDYIQNQDGADDSAPESMD